MGEQAPAGDDVSLKTQIAYRSHGQRHFFKKFLDRVKISGILCGL
jgi:hypothetical protein